MTKALFFKKDGLYTGFNINGHSGFASEGEDIVCAAISVLTINTVNSLDEITHEELCVDSSDGYLDVKILTNKNSGTQILMQALVLGLKSIQKEYGNKYLKVDYKEETQDD